MLMYLPDLLLALTFCYISAVMQGQQRMPVYVPEAVPQASSDNLG